MTTICMFFGLFLLHRILINISEEFFLPNWIKPSSVHTIFTIIVVVLLIFAIPYPKLALSFVMLLLFLATFYRQIIERVFFHRLGAEILLFYEEVSLEMAAGASFRESLEFKIRSKESLFSAKLAKIIESINYEMDLTKVCHSKLLPFAQEIHKIDRTQHRSLKLVRFYRDQYRSRQLIRQRSRAAAAQGQFQALISCFIFISILILMLLYSSKPSWGAIFSAFLLFFAGIVMIKRMGRLPKWNI